jgi:hypothetical protein
MSYLYLLVHAVPAWLYANLLQPNPLLLVFYICTLLQVCSEVVPVPAGARCPRMAVRQPAAAHPHATSLLCTLLFRFALRSYLYLLVHAVPAWLYANLLQPNPMLVFFVLSCSGLP